MIRLPVEQRDDALVLVIRQPKLAVNRVFGDGTQDPSLSAAVDVPTPRPSDGTYAPLVSRYSTMVFALAAIWGASYLFIKLGVEGGFAPATLMAARAAIASVILLGFLAVTIGARHALRELGDSWQRWAILGAVGNALPFWLVAWGETHIDSGIASIAQATVPLFTIVIGLRFLPHEPMGGRRWSGVVMGLVGVTVLTGLDPDGNRWLVVGTLAVVLSSVAYATANVYGQKSVASAAGPVLACGAMIATTFVLLPVALFQLPDAAPTGKAIGALLALATVGTAVAQLLLYRMLRLYGSRRMSLVTYLMPPFALAYGALFLDEPLRASALAGLVLILLGVGLGSGAIGSLRGRAATAATR
jgi:drug/metabolite transporter (DMT)-like permease